LSESVSTVAGILLAYGALRSLGGALPQLGEALIAWCEVRPLFEARAAGSRSAAPEQVANRASDAFCAFVSGNQLDLSVGEAFGRRFKKKATAHSGPHPGLKAGLGL
jgi:hypothetical protein